MTPQAFSLVILFSCVLCSSAGDPLLLKRISTGLVQGVWLDVQRQRSSPLRAAEKVAVWKSIPYGQAPVARLRWASPLPAASWSGVFDASTYRLPCVQPDGSGSEDCLHLHVTAPAGAASVSAALPVVVYIHGGGLMDGSGMYEYMSAFAAHANVVVVAINYRLNVFGWLALPALQLDDGSVGNYGLLDQQLALRWVRSNIMAFGGDAGRVTVAGQSSGGTSILALFSSPYSAGLFDGAISLSGSINISMDTSQAFAQNQIIADSLRCSGASTAQCLRNASVLQLTQAQRLSAWGQTPGIFGLDKTSPRGLSPSKQWIGLFVRQRAFKTLFLFFLPSLCLSSCPPPPQVSP
jgi:carboxylesterase type B